jgi:catechol 2,3-dioxygenase-like lactoylglutathione lyase family enzyme
VSAPRVVYLVHDFDLGRDFYKRVLGFEETFVDFDERWSTLKRGEMSIAVTQGEPNPDGGVAMVDVDDVKVEAERLRSQHVEVGTVIELAGQMRIVDVFDPDGNRIQLSQPLE